MSKAIIPVMTLEPGVCGVCYTDTLLLLEQSADKCRINASGTLGDCENLLYEGRVFCTRCGEDYSFNYSGMRIRLNATEVGEIARKVVNEMNPFSI